jgi:F-type H+-transporting ATPase subunit delta
VSENIARRYARAIFELARESNSVAEVVRHLSDFATAYDASRELRELNTMPNLRPGDRRAVMVALGQRIGAGEIATRGVSLLAERQRLPLLPDLVRVLETMADEHLGTLRGSVVSATQLDEAYRAELKRTIEQATGKRVLLTFEEDPTLIAGIVTQIGDQVIDGSVRGKLNELAASLRQN